MFVGMKKFVVSSATGLVVLAFASTASAQTTLPDISVDMVGLSTAVGVALGAVVATTITIFGAFLVVRYGLMWIRSTVGGSYESEEDRIDREDTEYEYAESVRRSSQM